MAALGNRRNDRVTITKEGMAIAEQFEIRIVEIIGGK